MLRQLTLEHAPTMRAWLQRPALAEYFRRYSPLMAWASDAELVSQAGYTWAVESEGRAVGLVNVSQIDQQAQRADIGVLICEEVPDRSGLARAALMQLGKHLFHFVGLHKVSCLVLPHRTNLAHWLQKNRFVKEGRLREHTFFNGTFHDEDVWSLLRVDFDELLSKEQ